MTLVVAASVATAALSSLDADCLASTAMGDASGAGASLWLGIEEAAGPACNCSEVVVPPLGSSAVSAGGVIGLGMLGLSGEGDVIIGDGIAGEANSKLAVETA